MAFPYDYQGIHTILFFFAHRVKSPITKLVEMLKHLLIPKNLALDRQLPVGLVHIHPCDVVIKYEKTIVHLFLHD